MGVGRKAKLMSEAQLYQYAISALARRMRSIAELKRMLRRRVEAETEIGKVLVELVIRRLKDEGYVNDRSYAAAYSQFRRENQKFGPRRVIADLRAKGVHADVIQAAVESTFAGVNQERLAREYLRRKCLKKPKDKKQAAAIVRQLIRAGFSPATTFKILKNWTLDEELCEELEGEVDNLDR